MSELNHTHLSSSERCLFIGAIVLMIGLAIPTMLAFHSEQEFSQQQYWIEHTHQVLESIKDISSLLDRAEAGVLGFALDRKLSYLEPAEKANRQVASKIEILSELVKDNAQQKTRLEKLSETANARLKALSAFADSAIESSKSQSPDLASYVRDGQRKSLEIHSLLSDMESEEHSLLASRLAQAKSANQHLKWTASTAFLLLVSILTVLALIATRSVAQRIRTEEQLRKNIEQMKCLNRDLEKAKDSAQDASKIKSSFVANMSHEIRSPMNAIIGMCSVLMRTSLSDQQRQYGTSIKEAGNSLLRVINDILDLSKMEAGHLAIEKTTFDPVQLVESSCELIANQARLRSISLMSYIDPDLSALLFGDPERIRQVLVNLLTNAIKFSEQGEVIVKAVLLPEAGTTTVRFSVSDQGIGLTHEQCERLFQAFSQADESINRRFGGTGLGLSISKNLVELMGGVIGVESVAGKGSTFWFNLPLETRAAGKVASRKSELSDVRVLVVDDEIEAQQIVHGYVTSWGMRNSTANGVHEALEKIRSAVADGDPYKIAVIDLCMPGKNGIDLAELILKDKAICDIKLVLMTAYDKPGLGSQALEHGFKGYIVKPIRQLQLMNCLIEVIAAETVTDGKPTTRQSETPELVLIVEDHPINQQVAQLYLEQLGLLFHTANNGKEALEAIKSNNYSLVLMDCQMPVMDGFSATIAIRNLERAIGGHLPIVAMTAHAMAGDREKCLSCGMDDYIAKPFDSEILRQMIDKWIKPAGGNINDLSDRLKVSNPIDYENLQARYQANFKELLPLFLKSGASSMEKMRGALSREDWNDLLEEAHGLKGVCATVCARGMQKTCSELETAGNEGNRRHASDLLDRLNEEFEQATRNIEELFENELFENELFEKEIVETAK